ncbi:MAG TPA: NADPH-dependent F420 reductase [Anaerolineae bacterium]|nr:NADPH-dependent F420 reductase [Anaerolineae bacterium]
MKIAILGGTGHEGAGLAYRWAAKGHTIIIGSRSAERAAQAADELTNKLTLISPNHGPLTGTDNLTAAQQGEIVVLSVPYSAQTPTLNAVKEALHDKILLTVVAPLGPKAARTWIPPEGSAAQQAQDLLGDTARVVAAFQTIGAAHLQDLDHVIDCDVLVCGDKKADRDIAVSLATDAGMRGVHAGSLVNAQVPEALVSMLIAINIRYKIKDAGIRITGLDNAPQEA